MKRRALWVALDPDTKLPFLAYASLEAALQQNPSKMIAVAPLSGGVVLSADPMHDLKVIRLVRIDLVEFDEKAARS